MKLSELKPNQLTDELMTEILYNGIQEDNQKGDCIFVFGSSKAAEYRLPKAVQLYKEGKANKLLLSGGTIWHPETEPEALVLKREAIQLGVPEKDILVETESTNTKENILASLLVLDREYSLHTIQRLLIVTASYHMRRTLLTLQTYMPHWIKFSPYPADDRNTRKENWFLNPTGRKRVEAEVKKIIYYIQIGSMKDDEI